MGAWVTATLEVITRSTLYCMAPVTSTTALAVWPFRVAVTSQVPVFSGRENLVEPTPFRVVSPSVQTTAAPAQVVTLILADWTPRASFSFFSVTLRFCPSAPEKNGTVSVRAMVLLSVSTWVGCW